MAKCVVMGITGGIAAYKAAQVVSNLRKAGVEVHCIMTAHAREFVAPLTFETLSANPVVTDMFQRTASWEVEHISLAQKADLFLIAPATANIIGKMARGIADDMLSTTVMATKAPILIAPAMNTGMYTNPAVQENLKILEERGCHFVGPESGVLACGDTGKGRMSEPDVITSAALALLDAKGRDMEGLRVIVTAGPTREPLDPVRYISNRSSGKMGYSIACNARDRGAKVTLVTGPVSLAEPYGIETVSVETTQEMMDAVLSRYDETDVVIKAAAPADYRPMEISPVKIKKEDGVAPVVRLTENPDIAAELGRRKHGQTLVVFAAETNDMLRYAAGKLARKGGDLMVANDVTAPGAGFSVDTNVVTFLYPDGTVEPMPKLSKADVASAILDRVLMIRNSH